ncbi:hypothetical protein LEP1GSC047_2568 [Leptospira inadai serovar Lyme str. 10]|uniref:Uncharacterized protein n=2 Tax=Leptospira inadai serovar Lyme TaxID=293084 RepID=V6HVM0_9LEPT|nr:hypothetical protein [Leptospira inadai]EQA36904.1 hypothetical protein LEP1GSC047_2568 [Leptospira inadai serovar Lyme str. 10]PNV75734.1 hypothetical protein BES34_006785 [Leptospira inadai serovar Lyme]
MELFAVFFLNIVLGVGLYIGITAQVTKRIRTHMIRRINEEVRTLVDEIQTEAENHIELLNSKVQAYKILVQKTDSLEETLRSILRKVEELPNRVVEKVTIDPVEKAGASTEFESEPEPEIHSEEIVSSSNKVDWEEIPKSAEAAFRDEYLTLIREKQKELKKSQDPLEEKRSVLTSKAGTGVGHLYKQNLPEEVPATSDKKPGTKTTRLENLGTGALSDQDSGTIGTLKNFGKKIKDALGWKDPEELLASPSPTRPTQPIYNPSSTFDISLDGDPFKEGSSLPSELGGTGSLKFQSGYKTGFGSMDAGTPSNVKIRNNKIPVEQDFGKLLERKISGREPQKPDIAKISPEAILKDLPGETTKIEKVVFLLKKGYSHADISEALDLATGEVDIIERFRLERNRRV